MTDLFGQAEREKNAAFQHDKTEGHDEWLTPPQLLTSLGEFDLDPCAPIKRPWPMAKQHLTIEDNGLIRPWHGRVWCNPPYGDEAKRWIKKLYGHGNGILLIFARTDTDVWQEFIFPLADAIFFINKRLRFYTVDGKPAPMSAGAPSALIAYGKQNIEAIRASGVRGWMVKPERAAND